MVSSTRHISDLNVPRLDGISHTLPARPSNPTHFKQCTRKYLRCFSFRREEASTCVTKSLRPVHHIGHQLPAHKTLGATRRIPKTPHGNLFSHNQSLYEQYPNMQMARSNRLHVASADHKYETCKRCICLYRKRDSAHATPTLTRIGEHTTRLHTNSLNEA